MSHRGIFPSAAEKSFGAGVFGAFRQTEQAATLEEGSLLFFSLSEISLLDACDPSSTWMVT